MSKRVESKKMAVFELEPDRFSIHTFELSKRLSRQEYHRMKDSLYRSQEGKIGKADIYQEQEGRHYCRKFEKHGVRVYLEHNRSENSAHTYFVRMIVNPCVLIDPKCSYLGILPSEESSIKKLKKAFQNLFQEIVFESDIRKYYISRLDLCTNVRCDSNKLFRELVRVLRKLPTPPKYERERYKHSDKKKANRYNKHYLRFCCGTHELVIYDKTYQLREGNLVVGYQGLPEGVLRFEVHCERAYIQRIERKLKKVDSLKILRKMMEESESRIIDHFGRCFPDTEFVQMEELEKRIKNSGIKGKNRDAMLKLVSLLQRTQSVDKALEKMENQGFRTEELLDRFTKLGVSPIPLWKNFCAKSLPGPVELLRTVAEGDVKVEYMKAKYK